MRRPSAALASAALALSALLALASAAKAQEAYPAKPVRVIVPNPAAGGADNIARPLSDLLSQALGQSFVVENRGGGSGVIGVEALVRAPKDGYTLMVAVNAPLVILPHVRKLPYDPFKDITPVALICETVSAVGIHPGVPAKTLDEFVAYSRANPGKINYASAGIGSVTHMRNEMMNRLGKLGMVHVPYKGNGEAIADLIAGNIQFMGESSVLNLTRQGGVRLIAFMAPNRHPEFPNIPIVAEAVPGFEAPTWYGLFAPGGTPPAIVAKLNATVGQILGRQEVKDRLIKIGYQVQTTTPEQLATLTRKHSDMYRKLVAELEIKPE